MRRATLLVLVGLGLVVFPEPATTLLGVVVFLAGVVLYLR